MTQSVDPEHNRQQESNSLDKGQNGTDAKDFWHRQCLHLQQEFHKLQLQHDGVINEFAQLRSEFAERQTELLNTLSIALQSNADMRMEVQMLKDEIARLKGTPKRPTIPPSGLEGPGSGKGGGSSGGKKETGKPGRGKHPRSKKTGLIFHNTVQIKPDNIPVGAKYKGARKYDVQDIIFQAHNTRYKIERWLLPDGTYVEGELPSHVQGHYGAALRAYVIAQTHSCRVTEELLLEQLHMIKIAISAGKLSEMLTEGHDDYHTENADILKAGIESGQIQTDDVGTRHRAKNCYTNVICNPFFVHLKTTDVKNRINFLTILAQGRKEYRFNQDAYDYLAEHTGTERLIQVLKLHQGLVINTQDPQKAFIDKLGHVNATEMRFLTEAGLYASLIEHGVPRNLNVHSDDAGQFDVFMQSLCWVHEERHYRKLIPVHPEIAAEIERTREGIWQLYQDLKAYKEVPSEMENIRVSKAFDSLFNPEKPNPYQVLNDRLALTYAKKERLLFVLKRPTTPLHNNASETGGRGAKVKCKISGGTRSDKGRQAWDTFGGLNLTCRRLGIGFYEYLIDRFLNLNVIARLGDIVRARTKAAYTVSESVFNNTVMGTF